MLDLLPVDLTLVLPPAPAPGLGLALAITYFKDELWRLLRICMSAQGPSSNKPYESSFKAQFPDLYMGKFHMDHYHFIQQYENCFETTQATRTNCNLFVAFYLSKNISIY